MSEFAVPNDPQAAVEYMLQTAPLFTKAHQWDWQAAARTVQGYAGMLSVSLA